MATLINKLCLKYLNMYNTCTRCNLCIGSCSFLLCMLAILKTTKGYIFNFSKNFTSNIKKNFCYIYVVSTTSKNYHVSKLRLRHRLFDIQGAARLFRLNYLFVFTATNQINCSVLRVIMTIFWSCSLHEN